MTDLESSLSARRTAGEEAYSAPASLTPVVASGVRWKLASQVVREGTRLAVGIVLARILTPEEWGLAGMALVVAALLQLIPELAMGYALVQRKSISEKDRSTVFWLSLGLGVTITLAGIALAPRVADFFGEPEVSELFIAASLGFTVASLATVPAALLTRDLAYRSLELRQIAGTLAGAVVAVTLALAGAGAWAIIGNSLAAISASTVLLWLLTPWRPRRTFSLESARTLGRFGATVFGSQLLLYAQSNADKLLIGRYLGAASLGSYSFAYNLMFAPILNVGFPLQQVLFPALATIQDDEERLRAAWLRGKRLAVAIIAPTFMLLAIVTPDLIPVVFGDHWDESIPVLQLLCVAGVAYSLGTLDWNILVVRNRVGTLLRMTGLVTVVLVFAFAFGLQWGIVGVATSFAVAQWALVLPVMWITTRAGRIGLRETIVAAGSALPFAAAAALVGLLVRVGLEEVGVQPGLRVVAVCACVPPLYAGFLWLGSKTFRNEERRLLASIGSRLGR